MKRFIKGRLNNLTSLLICAGLLAVIFLPVSGVAATVEFGIASMGWEYTTLEYTPTGGGPVEVNWLANGVDTRLYGGTAEVILNGVPNVPSPDPTFVTGTWQMFRPPDPPNPPEVVVAGISTGLTDATGTVGGEAIAQPTGGITGGAIEAVSDITLNSGPSSAQVTLADALFYGEFTVPSAGTISITAPYLLQLNLNSEIGATAYGQVSVILAIEDANGATLVSDTRSYLDSILGFGSSTFFDQNSTGPLAINYALSPGLTYRFRAEAFTSAYALDTTAVPEPSTLLLLGGGLIGLAATLRKRLRREL